MGKRRMLKNSPAKCRHVNPVYDYKKGEISCGDCGLVLGQQMIEGGPETV